MPLKNRLSPHRTLASPWADGWDRGDAPLPPLIKSCKRFARTEGGGSSTLWVGHGDDLPRISRMIEQRRRQGELRGKRTRI